MKKILTLTLLSWLFLILDNTLVPMLQIKGYYPCLLFVFIVSFSIINGTKEAVIISSLTGLLQDIYFYNGLGINAFANLLVCVLAAKIGSSIIRKKSFIPVISVFFLSALKGIFIFSILFILGYITKGRTILFSSIYNMVISVFMYKLIFKLCQKPFMKREWRIKREEF